MGIFRNLCTEAIENPRVRKYAEMIRYQGGYRIIESLEEIKAPSSAKTLDDVLGRKIMCMHDKCVYMFKTNWGWENYCRLGRQEFLQILVGKTCHELRHYHQDSIGEHLLGKERWQVFKDRVYDKYGYRNCPLEIDAREAESGQPLKNMTATLRKMIKENLDCLP